MIDLKRVVKDTTDQKKFGENLVKMFKKHTGIDVHIEAANEPVLEGHNGEVARGILTEIYKDMTEDPGLLKLDESLRDNLSLISRGMVFYVYRAATEAGVDLNEYGEHLIEDEWKTTFPAMFEELKSLDGVVD